MAGMPLCSGAAEEHSKHCTILMNFWQGKSNVSVTSKIVMWYWDKWAFHFIHPFHIYVVGKKTRSNLEADHSM